MNRKAIVIAVTLSLFLSLSLSDKCSVYGQNKDTPLNLKAIKQIHSDTCGLACLVSIFDYWNVDTNQRKLIQRYPSNEGSSGYTFGRLKQIAQNKGLHAYALYSEMAFLREQTSQGIPVMVALLVPYNIYNLRIVLKIPLYGEMFKFLTQTATYSHFVVVRSVRNGKVHIMDPMHGLKTLPKEAFRAMWDKMNNAALLVSG